MALAWEPDLLSPNLGLTTTINRDCLAHASMGCVVSLSLFTGKKAGAQRVTDGQCRTDGTRHSLNMPA